MKVSLMLFVLFLARVVADKVTPVEKVITLLENLKEECSEAAMEDAKTYDQFACFCKNQADFKLEAITKSKEKIAIHKAQIEMLEGEIDELNGEIPELKDKVKKLTKKQKKADEKREKEFEKYTEEEKDLATAIDSIERAIEVLMNSKKQMTGAKQGYTLAQLAQEVADATQRFSGKYPVPPHQLTALLDLAAAPGQPHAYDGSRSNEIISTLQDLLKKFKADKVDLDTTESETRNEYELAKQERENTIKFTQEDIDSKEKIVADKEQEKEESEEIKKQETEMKKADKAFMDELTDQCENKAKDFDQRSKARAAEITALSEATEILKAGVQSNYGANKKLTGFLASVKDHKNKDSEEKEEKNSTSTEKEKQQKKEKPGNTNENKENKQPASFLQINDEASAPSKVLEFLTQQANALKSPLLSTLTLKLTFTDKLKLATAKDHFVKVRTMIKDLIEKLEADAESEADQKSFCDENMEKAISDRDEANGDVEGSTADIDQAKSKIADLTEDVKMLENEIAELRKGLFEATELRKKEKEGNEKTIADSKAGLEAVKKAIDVLKDFYGFIQTGFTPKGAGRDGKTVGDMAPKGVEGEYEGNKDAASGILGLLDVIVSDFERTIETTEKEEEDAKKKFEDYKKDTESDIDDKAKAKKEKLTDIKSTEADLVGFKEDLKSARDNLKDAKAELAKLKPLCVDTGMSWKERRAQQKAEVEALKQALVILTEWKG